jgi:hypothetical protein
LAGPRIFTPAAEAIRLRRYVNELAGWRGEI